MVVRIYFLGENRKISLNALDKTPRFDPDEFGEWINNLHTIRTMVVSSISKSSGIIGQSLNISMEINGIPIERKFRYDFHFYFDSDLKSIISLLKKRYSAISFPTFFDEPEEKIHSKYMKLLIAQAVQCLGSIPFFMEDSDFSDFIYSQGYKGSGFSIKGFRVYLLLFLFVLFL